MCLVEEQHTEGFKIADQTEKFGAEDRSDLVDLNKKEKRGDGQSHLSRRIQGATQRS